MKINRYQFIITACIIVVLALAFFLLWEVKNDHTVLAARMDGVLNTQGSLEQENEELMADLAQAQARIEELEEQLETMFVIAATVELVSAEKRGGDLCLLSPSGFTADMYERAFKKLGATGMEGTGHIFVKGEALYGVNGLGMAALAYHESGGGASALARIKNNFFGWRAYHPKPFENGMAFSSKEEGILYVIERIKALYLTEGGTYHKGTAFRSMTAYAEDPAWAEKIGRVMGAIADAAIEKRE